MNPVKYPHTIKQRRLGDKLFVLECIRDLDEAIDMLCESMSPEEQSDPFAEDLCPYFGILWPAAEALAQFLHDRPELVKGKSVLELGCGLGLPSLVASHLGGKVLATDFHPQVEEYFQRNCRHSVVECRYERLNWREDKQDIGRFDVVLGSDVLYERPGGKIVLADPGRAYLKNFINSMRSLGYCEEMTSVKVDEKEIFLLSF